MQSRVTCFIKLDVLCNVVKQSCEKCSCPSLLITQVFLFFQTFEYFRETTQLLEQHGSVSVRNGKVAILQDKDVSFSANMWRPILTAYWVSNISVPHEPLTNCM